MYVRGWPQGSHQVFLSASINHDPVILQNRDGNNFPLSGLFLIKKTIHISFRWLKLYSVAMDPQEVIPSKKFRHFRPWFPCSLHVLSLFFFVTWPPPRPLECVGSLLRGGSNPIRPPLLSLLTLSPQAMHLQISYSLTAQRRRITESVWRGSPVSIRIW